MAGEFAAVEAEARERVLIGGKSRQEEFLRDNCGSSFSDSRHSLTGLEHVEGVEGVLE